MRRDAHCARRGIGVILGGNIGDTVGAQVKRYKDRISVAQVRELTGALVINGHTRGLFITTSEFQSGAYKAAKQSSTRGHPIELLDAPAFLVTL
jgi:restriction system protein